MSDEILEQKPAEKKLKELSNTDKSSNHNLLHSAIKKSDRKTAYQILNTSTAHDAIDSRDEEGCTALHIAAAYGELQVIETLLEKKADLNVIDQFNKTPLHHAVKNKHPKTTTRLLEKGIDINATDEKGYTALHRAVLNDDEVMTELLLTKKAQIDVEDKQEAISLHYATSRGQKNITSLLLAEAKNNSISQRNTENTPYLNKQDAYGKTPLHDATEKGHSEIIKLLLEAKASVNSQNTKGRTPLHLATLHVPVADQQLSIVKMLLDSKCMPHLDERGFTALELLTDEELALLSSYYFTPFIAKDSASPSSTVKEDFPPACELDEKEIAENKEKKNLLIKINIHKKYRKNN